MHCYNCHGTCQSALYCERNQISVRCEHCWAAVAKPTEHSPFCSNRDISGYLSSSDRKHRAIDLLLIESDTDIAEFKNNGILPTSIGCAVQSELHQHISYVFNNNRSISMKSPEPIYWRIAFVNEQSILCLVNVTGRKFDVMLVHSPWRREFKQIPLYNQVALVCFLSIQTKSVKLFGPTQSMELTIMDGCIYLADDIPHEYERFKQDTSRSTADPSNTLDSSNTSDSSNSSSPNLLIDSDGSIETAKATKIDDQSTITE